ncbi:hypothetical protein Aoc01nite_52090 [Actinoplanes octamycinicus]|nr:hypothetical protein Aoc01nite_52090 [Actinoplanes octamycinicus]
MVLLGCAPAAVTQREPAGPVAVAPRAPHSDARATPDQALPGRSITVTVSGRGGIDVADPDGGKAADPWELTGCVVYFDGQDKEKCPDKAPFTVELEVPERGELHWEAFYENHESETDVVPFAVLRLEVTADPEVVTPGQPLDVTFSISGGDARIGTCWATIAKVTGGCDKEPATSKAIRVVVPEDLPRGEERTVTWFVTLEGPDGQPIDQKRSSLTVWVPFPPPAFDVSPSTAQPGLPLVVTFRSGTTGVDIDTCGITYHGEAPCSAAHTAMVMVPPDAPVGSVLSIPWTLTYRSARPHEEPGDDGGTLTVEVVAIPVRFTVTSQPGSGYPGQEVTLTIEPAEPDLTIVGCLAFFPNDDGDKGQATEERWLIRTHVPEGASPGATLLRWGVAAVNKAGKPAPDNGDLPFEVLASPTSPPTPRPSRETPTPLPTTTTDAPIPLPTTTTDAPAPEFVARTSPEAARPGRPVRLTVTAVTPATTITGCRAGFGGTRAQPCDVNGGRWTATLTVPDDADPGDLPLLWDVDSATGPGQGTIAYRVLGGDPVVPQFGAAVEPASVRPGEHVRVTHRSYAGGPAITGCNAGIAPGGVLAACTSTAEGWITDVVVPDRAPPGTATLLWQVSYAGDAGTATADGRTSIGVLAGDDEPRSWWQKALGVAWRVGAVAAFGVVLIGGRALLRRLSDRLRRTPGGDDTRLPDGVAVLAVPPAGPVPVALADPDTAPRRLIRLIVRRPPPAVRTPEEPP